MSNIRSFLFCPNLGQDAFSFPLISVSFSNSFANACLSKSCAVAAAEAVGKNWYCTASEYQVTSPSFMHILLAFKKRSPVLIQKNESDNSKLLKLLQLLFYKPIHIDIYNLYL